MGCEYCLTTNCPTCEEMTDLLRDARAEGAASALAADRARIAQAIRKERANWNPETGMYWALTVLLGVAEGA